jgi:ribokinase
VWNLLFKKYAKIIIMKKYDFVGLGDTVIDTFIELEEAWIEHDNPELKAELCMKFGEKLPYKKAVTVKGTGNSNNAVHAAKKLGLSVATISNIGEDDDGKEILKSFQEKEIDTDFIQIHPNQNTNHNFILRYKAERTILVHHNEYSYKLPENMPEINWLYLSSLAKNSTDFHHEIANFLKNNPETKLAFQPGTFQIKLGKQELADIYSLSHIFFCNKEEAQTILQTNDDSIKNLLSQINALGPKIVVITDGPKGAYVFDGQDYFRGEMYPDSKPPADRTGAGDSFSATFVVALAKGKNIEEALMWGPVNSASVVQHVGAQAGHLNEAELLTWLEKAPKNYKPEKI